MPADQVRTTPRMQRWIESTQEPSLRLRIVAGYFRLIGALGLFGVGTMVLFVSAAPELLIKIAGGAATSIAFLATGAQLRRRRRIAGIGALGAFAFPLATLIAGRVSISTLVTSLVGLALVGSVWRELE